MRFKTIHEVLAWTGSFHQHLAEEYQRLSNGESRERLRLILQYLADHELALQQALAAYCDGGHDGALDTWYDSAPDIPLPTPSSTLLSAAQPEAAIMLVHAALAFHDTVIELYTKMAAIAPNETVREIFENLCALENHEKLRLVRATTALDDC
ncbi:hypothetical protein [Isoalcanivorax indicus]|uniref:hypothetical protein n=1 Tax=Isoalcanivorax indicus TaxID=2202653 RepID=UPI000DB9A534|nr:hypothetical protein [Isoalcanivorax indicus]